MRFTFKRDREGQETAHVNGVCIAIIDKDYNVTWQPVTHYTGVTTPIMDAAIERADEAGFWCSMSTLNTKFNRTIIGGVDEPFRVSEVTVDVPPPEEE